MATPSITAPSPLPRNPTPPAPHPPALRRWALAGLLGMLFHLPSAHAAADGPADFPAARYPFLPQWVENNNPELCRLALKWAREGFFSHWFQPGIPHPTGDGVSWPEWLPLPKVGNRSEEFVHLDLDLDGDGRQRGLLSWKSFGNDDHTTRYGLLYPSLEQRNQEYANLGKVINFLWSLRYGPTDQPAIPVIIHHETDTQFLGLPDKVEERVGLNRYLFSWNKSYYLVRESNPWRLNEENLLEFSRLTSSGALELQCRVKIHPAAEEIGPWSRQAGLGSFFKVLSAMGHGGFGGCGSLRANDRHTDQGDTAISRAMLRPWAATPLDYSRQDEWSERRYYRYNERLMHFLEGWSYSDVMNRREYLAFLQHLPPAIDSLARHYRERFGLEEEPSRLHAQRVAEELIGDWVLVPHEYKPGDFPLPHYNYFNPASHALLTGNETELKEVFAQYPIRDRGPYDRDIPRQEWLPDAVAWPKGMEILLQSGANPNAVNKFGKTPLMTAAHLDRPDAARLLLDHKAEVNARTLKEFYECGYEVKRGHRTALMYAAENAGAEMMTLLLKAGADANAKDSQGNDLAFYLAKNPRYTPEEKALGIVRLAAEKLEAEKAPGFDCAKAASRIEKAICADPLLRRRDGEMARAYQRWIRPLSEPDKAAALKDQRRWLAQRQEHCPVSTSEEETFCLQGWTAARIRYLHHRLTEPDAKGYPFGDHPG
ncbi:MAG: ankyrin repeat domain-containing protein [Magnetococcales bacterium]|nr:ankyrin repeat domain-containing protein [Magnetococcales bacterium]